jgi:hypothetical protein
MGMIGPSAVFRKSERIICREAGESRVLIDPYRRTQVSLNPAGGSIWDMIDGKNSFADILDALGHEYEGAAGQMEKDLRGFLNDLLKREMIF